LLHLTVASDHLPTAAVGSGLDAHGFFAYAIANFALFMI
jgi:hypothetical protein